MVSLTCSSAPRPLLCSLGHIPDRMCEHLLHRDKTKCAVLGRRLPACLPHRVGRGFHIRVRSYVHLQHVASEQSVAGGLFQAMTQIGSAIGLRVSTIVLNWVLKAQSSGLGVSLDQEGDDAPPAAQLKAYQAAVWIGLAFGILCGS